MTPAPRVSIVMPAYNASRTIGEAIRSVLGQTCADFELVVCDDASTDDTARIVAAVADGRVRLLEQARNAGPGAARDHAIDAARGTWIALIDADDAWAPERLERLLDAAGNDDRMVFDDILLCHDAPGGMIPWRRLHGTRAFGAVGGQPQDVPVASYVRAERLLIKPLIPARHIREHRVRHTQRRFGEDAEYFLRLAALGVKLRYLPEPLYRYRITPGSATAVASDPTLMRQCLAECSVYPGFDADAREGFALKIAQLQDYEALYGVQRALGQRNLRAAWTALARRPRSLLSVWPLALRRLGYMLHRRATGGIGR